MINVSHSLSRLAIKDGLNSERKQCVIGYGICGGLDAQNVFNSDIIDIDKQSAIRKEFSLDDADIVFGFCGRICVDKGIPELIDSFELFQRNNPRTKAKLLIIGQYDVRDGISTAKKQQMESNKDIVISGCIQKENIPYYYSLLDCFVFPSHREGFGMCVLEVSAMKIPILVSRAHGCEDSIVEHITGECIDTTPESICAGMENMLDANLRNSIGDNGRKNVLECYDFRIMWSLVKNLYKRILKQETFMYKYFFKRLFDFILAFIALLCLSPVFIVVTIGLYFANKGAGAFFFQERPGKGGEIFKVIKYKTMTDERGVDGILLPDAIRLTKVGRFVRSTSIDELPQLINVLKGEMALIGPRPLLVQYLPLYSKEQARRHDVRPGITGWAQCHGRNAISWKKKFELDVWYVDHCNLFTDIKVIFITIKKVLFKEDINSETAATMELFNGNN